MTLETLETVDAAAPHAGDVAGRARSWLRARVDRDESGIALVWMAMFLMVILGFAALAIDIGHGYAVAQRAQNAADSAALAGTIYLPTDVTTAYSTAQTTAASNGFTNGVNNVTVIPQQQTTVSQLKVTVKQTVPTWFARVIGIKTMNISRSGTADYRPPVAMGSPSNQYGNDPESSGTAGSTMYPNLWAHVAGPGSYKENGDAYSSSNCNGSDNCSSPPSDTSCGYTGTNSDYTCSGYYYAVHVPSATSSLKLQAFDPGFTAVGDSCGSNDDGSNLVGAAALTAAQVQGYPSSSVTPATRYAPVTDPNNPSDPGLRYCTGDHIFDSSDFNFTTTFKVFGPAAVPGDPTSAPATPLCTKSYPTVSGDLAAALQSTTKQNVYVNGVLTPEYLGQYFRQWDNLCPGAGTINASAADYFIQVRTNLTPTGQATFIGKGGNRFALRATPTTTNIYGDGKMGIYANVGGGVSTSFYLARILPGDAGHTLTLALFDVGDGSSSGTPGTLTIVPPTDGTNNGGSLSLSGCTMQLGSGSSYVATNGSTGCQVTGVTSASYQNKWLTIQVPIPSGYSCTVATASNCWFKINYQFSGYIDDTTSWTASLGGDPVRIVQ